MNLISKNFTKSALCLCLLAIVGWNTSLHAQLSLVPPQPWPSKDVSVSFAPDFVEVGRYRNELEQHLNSQMSNPDWKIEILRALQTWSQYCGVQFSLVADSNRAFGVPGLAQGDPRFGDIRFGAFPQVNVLGNAVGYNAAFGTWAGDILFDTNRVFYSHALGSNPGQQEQYDLYTVALHEIGNALGLVDNFNDPNSVMYFNYTGPKFVPTPSDIRNIQSLYGPPATDVFESPASNNNPSTASIVQYDGQFATSKIQSVFGRIQNGRDRDYFRLSGNQLAENCWIKVRGRGNSLLAAKLTVLDSQLSELATISAENPINNTFGKEITNITPDATIYVLVEPADPNSFSSGDYELVFDFNANGFEELGQPVDDDDELLDPYFEAKDEALVDALYAVRGLIDTETSQNNTFATPTRLLSPLGTPSDTRYEYIGTLASLADRDMYVLHSPANSSGTMAIDLIPLGVDPALLSISIFDSERRSIPFSQRFRNSTDVVVEANNIQPDRDYFVRVQSRTGNTIAGNYLLTVNLTTKSSPSTRFGRVNLSRSNPDQWGSLTVYKTQLLRIDLEMTSADAANQACQLTVYSDTGRTELVTSVRSGTKRTCYVWLQAGDHSFRLTSKTRRNRPIVTSRVDLFGAIVSDDEGPIIIDPSGNPISGPQLPSGPPSPPTFWQFPIVQILQLIIPPELPW